jgi:hypothetical protein
MPITINGTTGIAGVDGSASTPSLQGADTNTGMFFPAADTIAFAEGGVEAMRLDSAGNVGIGTTNATARLTVNNTTDNSTVAILHTGGGTPNRGLKISTFSSTNDNAGVLLDAQTTVGGAALALGTAGTEQMRITTAGLLQFNSGYGSVATAYGCRAWVNFNGTGTVAIRGSGNVSSITDRNTGRYTVNLTTAMPDANYNVSCGGSTNNADNVGESFQAYASSTTAIPVTSGTGTAFVDSPTVCIAIFR